MTHFSTWIMASSKNIWKRPTIILLIGLQFCSYWFWWFSWNTDFHVYISKELTNLGLIFLVALQESGKKSKLFLIYIFMFYLFVLFFEIKIFFLTCLSFCNIVKQLPWARVLVVSTNKSNQTAHTHLPTIQFL